MNKCYFGNFQDFCKYGLLCELARACKDAFSYSLCFGQMTTTPDRIPASDKNWDFLKDKKSENLRTLDKELFDKLRDWRAGKMGESWLDASRELFPSDMSVPHYNDPMPLDKEERYGFFRSMRDNFPGQNRVVFLNPDYGLDFAARLLKGGATGGDHRCYLMAEEIPAFLQKGMSVLFYQEALSSPRGEDIQRNVIQHLRNTRIRERVYFFESRAPSYTGEEITATSGFFWVVPKTQIPFAEKFYKNFQVSNWCQRNIGILNNDSCFAAEQRIGVFVDIENIGYKQNKIIFAHNSIGLGERIAPMGKIVRHLVCGKKGNHEALFCSLRKVGLTPRLVGYGKNKADIELSCDIGEQIFQAHIDIAVVISGDAGFSFIARLARAMGVEYYGIGNNQTRNEYRKECDDFYEISGSKPEDFELKRAKRKQT